MIKSCRDTPTTGNKRTGMIEKSLKSLGLSADEIKIYFKLLETGSTTAGELAKRIGLKPARRIEFFTGKIDCRLLEYELYDGTRRTDK